MDYKEKFFCFNFSLFTFCCTFVPLFANSDISNRGVAQLVAHLVWDQVVARSSRVTPTFFSPQQHSDLCSEKNRA